MRKDTLFDAYAAHSQAIEDFIELLSSQDNPNDEVMQRTCAACAGLNFNSISFFDLKYMEEEVKRRYEYKH